MEAGEEKQDGGWWIRSGGRGRKGDHEGAGQKGHTEGGRRRKGYNVNKIATRRGGEGGGQRFAVVSPPPPPSVVERGR